MVGSIRPRWRFGPDFRYTVDMQQLKPPSLSGATFADRAFEWLEAAIIKGDLAPGFAIDLAYKDMGLASDLAEALAVPIETGRAAMGAYRGAREAGRGGEDWTAVHAWARARAGLADR